MCPRDAPPSQPTRRSALPLRSRLLGVAAGAGVRTRLMRLAPSDQDADIISQLLLPSARARRTVDVEGGAAGLAAAGCAAAAHAGSKQRLGVGKRAVGRLCTLQWRSITSGTSSSRGSSRLRQQQAATAAAMQLTCPTPQSTVHTHPQQRHCDGTSQAARLPRMLTPSSGRQRL